MSVIIDWPATRHVLNGFVAGVSVLGWQTKGTRFKAYYRLLGEHTHIYMVSGETWGMQELSRMVHFLMSFLIDILFFFYCVV